LAVYFVFAIGSAERGRCLRACGNGGSGSGKGGGGSGIGGIARVANVCNNSLIKDISSHSTFC
jgi:hypothetical protein